MVENTNKIPLATPYIHTQDGQSERLSCEENQCKRIACKQRFTVRWRWLLCKKIRGLFVYFAARNIFFF